MSDPSRKHDTRTIPREETQTQVRRQPPYNVVLLDDDDHSYEYVIHMLQVLFGFPRGQGYQHAEEVDRNGRTILLTTTLEHAELKQDQIHAFGPDNRISGCAGSMSAIIEPVEG